MISLSSDPQQQSDDRYSVMLAHFALCTPRTQQPRSMLCRVLDGRGLEDVWQSDAVILTPEERAHYHAALKHPRTHAMAVRSRAELRRMLARETGLPPHQVPILCDTHGKPCCPHPGVADLDFSVSHTEECAIIALGEAAGIGVDVEQVLEKEPAGEYLDIVFNEDEFRAWATLTPEQRRLSFTQAWTIKEAVLKALGMGLDGDTHSVSVTFDADGHAWPVLPPEWVFERIAFCPRYAASFVAWMPGEDRPRERMAACAL
ncbi:MAG: 4'-phosphopantetheinyl transferase family protein [Roseimicrobium sp.]